MLFNIISIKDTYKQIELFTWRLKASVVFMSTHVHTTLGQTYFTRLTVNTIIPEIKPAQYTAESMISQYLCDAVLKPQHITKPLSPSDWDWNIIYQDQTKTHGTYKKVQKSSVLVLFFQSSFIWATVAQKVKWVVTLSRGQRFDSSKDKCPWARHLTY